MQRCGFAGRGRGRGLVEEQAVGFGVVGEDLGVAPPIQGCVDLALNIFLGEVLVQNVAKEFYGDCPVGLSLESIPDLLNQSDVAEDRFTKEFFSGGDIGFGEFLSGGSNLHVALGCVGEAQHDGLVDDGKEVVHFHQQLFGQVVQVFFAATIVQELEQSGHAAGGCVGQYLE